MNHTETTCFLPQSFHERSNNWINRISPAINNDENTFTGQDVTLLSRPEHVPHVRGGDLHHAVHGLQLSGVQPVKEKDRLPPSIYPPHHHHAARGLQLSGVQPVKKEDSLRLPSIHAPHYHFPMNHDNKIPPLTPMPLPFPPQSPTPYQQTFSYMNPQSSSYQTYENKEKIGEDVDDVDLDVSSFCNQSVGDDKEEENSGIIYSNTPPLPTRASVISSGINHIKKDQDIKIMEYGLNAQWIDDDPSLPEGTLSFVFCFVILTFKPSGWKMRVTETTSKLGPVAMQWFLSPEGKSFRGRRSTLEHITKCGKYSEEDIRKFKSSGRTPKKPHRDWKTIQKERREKDEAISILEKYYATEAKFIRGSAKHQLAAKTGLSLGYITNWFCTKRRNERRRFSDLPIFNALDYKAVHSVWKYTPYYGYFLSDTISSDYF